MKKASSVKLHWPTLLLNRLLFLLGVAIAEAPAAAAHARPQRSLPRPSRPRRRRPTAPPRDFQRRRVYAWEAAAIRPTEGGELSLAACERLIEEAYRWHERPRPGDIAWRPPVLGDGRGRRHACGSREVIKLPRWARTRAIVLHECAHGMSDDGHGPGFVRAYVRLLAAFEGHDPAALEASLRAHKVKIAPDR